MAKRRMFTPDIIDTDTFLDMPQSTQNLYFHLGMRADDEGFIGNINRIMKMLGSSEDDKRVLIAKRYIIQFESGVVVIKHWKMNNYLQNDRIKETTYLTEKGLLYLKENKAYTLDSTQGTPLLVSVEAPQIEEPKEKQTKIDELISMQNEELQPILREFLKMRKSIKKPMTDYAVKLLINNLNKLSSNLQEQKQILNNSIENCWQGVFALKTKQTEKSFDPYSNQTKNY